MPFAAEPIVRRLRFEGAGGESGIAAQIVTGPRTTRQTVANDFPGAPIGTIYISTGTNAPIYVKIAASGASVDTDWQRVTVSAAD